MAAVNMVTMNPSASGINAPIVVHRTLSVSL